MLATILIVDDDDALLRSLGRGLRREDRLILTASGSEPALALLRDHVVDVIISDERMPGMVGSQLLKRLRGDYPTLVRILMTGQPTMDSAVAAVNDEVFRYLPKPCSLDDLDKVVDAAVERAHEWRQATQASADAQRKQRLRTELEAEHPGLLTVVPGPYSVKPSPLGDALVASLVVEAAAAQAALPAEGKAAGPIALANAMIELVLSHPRCALSVQPSGRAHRVFVDLDGQPRPLFEISAALGDAVAARLAVIAGLDPSTVGNQLQRFVARLEGQAAELLLALTTSASGLGVDLRRLLTLADLEEVAVAEDGQVLGAYRLHEKIGEGALGIVYRASRTSEEGDGRPLAIKLLRKSAIVEPLGSARLLREVKAASLARNPGIVEVFDCGRLPDARPFLVMELITAPTLEQRLAKGPLAPSEAVRVARAIAVALGAAHDAGIVHRDLKPSNLFVDDDLAIKISDFGAAKLLGDSARLTTDGSTIGTPSYMAPEQARGEPIDCRTDLYALGCVLFEMLSGHPPFAGTSALHVISAHLFAPIPDPTSPLGPVPLALSRTIQRAMAKSPRERHQTTRELIADLDQALRSVQRMGWRKWLQ